MPLLRTVSMKKDKAVKGSSRVALDFLFSLEDEELDYLLVSGVPDRVFLSLGATFDSDELTELPDVEDYSYSGLRPHIYLSDKVTGAEAIANVSQGLWKLAQELYSNPEMDKADLSAWVEDGFPFILQRVSRSALLKHAVTTTGFPLIRKEKKSDSLRAWAMFKTLQA